MNTATREGPVARPLPPGIEEGDVVTLKSDDHEPRRRYVVLGAVWCMPALYLVRHANPPFADELAVRRCEIATVERPGPLLLDGVPVMPTGDPPPTAAAAKPPESINWLAPNERNEIKSADYRFAVYSNHENGGLWQAFDHDKGEKSGDLAVREHAVTWCERRAKDCPDDTLPF
jgi:hypothetical protein